MRIGILGSGLMGGKRGTIFAQAGHEVVFNYARSNSKLKRLARDAQAMHAPAHLARPGRERTRSCWPCIDDAPKQAGDLSGKVVVTRSLPMEVGSLRIARHTEPFALLVGTLAYSGEGGPELAFRFEPFGR